LNEVPAMSKRCVARWALVLLPLLVASACNGSQAPAPEASRGSNFATPVGHGDAVLQLGDVSIRASVVQTSALPMSVARQYAIERNPKTVLLLVAVRKGPSASAVALPARVTVTVTDLRGGQQQIAMREVQTDALVDSIGTTQTTLPDTLRFDVVVVVAGMAPVKVQFEREFYPQ
jgi:hypothetical protein